MAILAPADLAELETSTLECTDFACLHATSHVSLCDCSTCFGLGHGALTRAARARGAAGFQARVARAGGVFALLATDDDDEAF